jgi:ectoine hydroxylase-related dioxygenase (phytanoyl-CoA dioxygenase family)
MRFEQEKMAYDRDGFVVVGQLLAQSDFEELRSNLTRYIHEVVSTLSDTEAFYEDRSRPETLKQIQRMARDPFFDAYRRHPRWLTLAESLLGEKAMADEPEWFNKPPNSKGTTPPHQDNYYFCLKPPQVMTMWLALDVVDEENGCLRYIPGSHMLGVRPHGRSEILGFSQGILDYGKDDEAREIPISLQPGDVTIHHGNTIHRADPNRSATRDRRAFALVFRGASCQRDEAAHARYLADARRQQASMGLTV